MRTTTITCAAVIAVLLLPIGAARATVTLSSAVDTNTVVVAGSSQSESLDDTSIGLLFSETLAVSRGSAYASTSLTRSQAYFDWLLADQRSRYAQDYAQNTGTYVFTVDRPTTYTIQGTYGGATSQYTALGARLHVVGNSDYLLNDWQYSYQSNVTLALASPTNTRYYHFEGSLTGTLQRGDTYEFWYTVATEAYPNTDLGAVTGGDLSITFGAASVPEPCSLLVWSGLGMVGLVLARRRRKHAV